MTAWLRLALATLVALGGPPAAFALASSQTPAALLVFPLIMVDEATSTDTLVQVTNTGDTEQRVRCTYYDPAGPTATDFSFRLGAGQPAAWLVGQGATLPASGDTIPSAQFTGALRCAAVDEGGLPVASDVLVGLATIQPAEGAAAYAAIGFAARPGGTGTDELLVLGGENAEYDACPAAVATQVLLDGARLSLGPDGTTERDAATTLAITTCGARAETATTVSVVVSLVNEFGQLFSVVRTVRDQLISPLSLLDTDMPARSVFRASLQGGATGTIRITPQGGSGGVLALTLQAFGAPDTAPDVLGAAPAAQLIGERIDADVVELASDAVATPTATPPPACGGDCNGDGMVVINELVAAVNIALGNQSLATCNAADGNRDGMVTVNELVVAVNRALNGC